MYLLNAHVRTHKRGFAPRILRTRLIEKAGTSGNKSRTICEDKADIKIKSILKGNIPSDCSPSFG